MTSSFALPEPYATAADLAAYWGKALSEAEQTRATGLLGWAAQLINEQPGFEHFDPVVCAMISMDMVKRAMLSKGDGVIGASQSMADQSATIKYLNPAGNLYLTAGEQCRLAGRPETGGGMSLALNSNVRVPREPWNSQPSSQADASD